MTSHAPQIVPSKSILKLHPSVSLDADDRFEKICDDPFALLATLVSDPSVLSRYTRHRFFYLDGLPTARRKTGARGANVFTKDILTDKATKIIKSRPAWFALADQEVEWDTDVKNSISEVGNAKYAALSGEKGVRPISFFQLLRICAAHEAVAEALWKGNKKKTDKKELYNIKREIYKSLTAVPATYTVSNLAAIKKQLEAKFPKIEEFVSVELGQVYDRDTIFQSYWRDKRYKKYLSDKPKRKKDGKDPEVLFILTGMAREFGVTLATAQRLSDSITELRALGIVDALGGDVKDMAPTMKGDEAYHYEPVAFGSYLQTEVALNSLNVANLVP